MEDRLPDVARNITQTIQSDRVRRRNRRRSNHHGATGGSCNVQSLIPATWGDGITIPRYDPSTAQMWETEETDGTTSTTTAFLGRSYSQMKTKNPNIQNINICRTVYILIKLTTDIWIEFEFM